MGNKNILDNEDALLRGMLEAVEDRENETLLIEIARKGKVFFAFRIRPITEKEQEKCQDSASKFTRTRGIKILESTDSAKYRSMLIHTATVSEDREKTWDSKKLWEGLNVLNGVEVIDKVLLPGEKEAVIQKINEISGHGDREEDEESLDETAKN